MKVQASGPLPPNPHPLLPSDVQAGLKLQYNGMEERMVSWR